MTTDAQGRERRGVYLPPECWAWLETTADADTPGRGERGSINDLLEGLVLLAMDRAGA